MLPGGKVELLSTHDQLLGGPSGQSYLGCRFPADFAYARAISHESMKVGERLAREGVLGRFALDFVTVKDAAGEWSPYAIEINLRKGGTTHPFLTLQFLTDGRYDAATGLFMTQAGREKHLVATDHFESDSLRGLSIDDLFDIVARHGLHFSASRLGSQLCSQQRCALSRIAAHGQSRRASRTWATPLALPGCGPPRGPEGRRLLHEGRDSRSVPEAR